MNVIPPQQFEITGDQALALGALIDEHNDDSAVILTMRDDGSLMVGFSLGLFTIKPDGDVVE